MIKAEKIPVSSSPMTAAALHDQLVLLDGGKRWPVPGACKVKVTLAAETDSQPLPGDGKAVTQLNEATGEVEVQVTMWEAEQWDKYQSLLGHLRRGTKDGPAVFTSAHPEIRGRRIKRLYFVSEEGGSYSPKSGYSATLKFSEKLKEKSSAAPVGDTTPIQVPGSGVTVAGGSAPASAAGQAVAQSMLRSLTEPPAPADGGRANTAQPGYCSASVRVAAVRAGMKPSLFGGSAKATEANFRAAKLSRPWNADSARDVREGDIIFWGNDPSGSGHIGVVVGRDKDGMPLIAGNNLVTAGRNGGRDARGIVRMNELGTAKSQPTSIGRPGGFAARTAPAVQGPAAPLPSNLPSQNVKVPGK